MNDIKTEKSLGEVSRQVQALNDEISLYGNLVAELKYAIAPVLAMAYPENVEDKEVLSSNTPLGVEVENLKYRMKSTNQELQGLIQRVDL